MASSADEADQDGERGGEKGKRRKWDMETDCGFELRPQQVREGCFRQSDGRAVFCKTVINSIFFFFVLKYFLL